MKVVDVSLFNFKEIETIVCCVLLDCTYVELLKEEAKIWKSEPENTIKKKEKSLIIGITKPDDSFSELCASINRVNPVTAKASLLISPSDINLIPTNSEIKLLRYE